ncbi:Uncharacterised protein [Vibrio cholerae]|nr:Uncharacterised protein [Vibrio cholerae]CSI71262.1 Uncharacterised protein [Vibrio cholerae]CSI85676.1 Uncharacterised protein [Vibrio cholerae]
MNRNKKVGAHFSSAPFLHGAAVLATFGQPNHMV